MQVTWHSTDRPKGGLILEMLTLLYCSHFDHVQLGEKECDHPSYCMGLPVTVSNDFEREENQDYVLYKTRYYHQGYASGSFAHTSLIAVSQHHLTNLTRCLWGTLRRFLRVSVIAARLQIFYKN